MRAVLTRADPEAVVATEVDAEAVEDLAHTTETATKKVLPRSNRPKATIRVELAGDTRMILIIKHPDISARATSK